MILKIKREASLLLFMFMIVNLSVSYNFLNEKNLKIQKFVLKALDEGKVKAVVEENRQINLNGLEDKLFEKFYFPCDDNFQITVNIQPGISPGYRTKLRIQSKCGNGQERVYKVQTLFPIQQLDLSQFQRIKSQKIYQNRLLYSLGYSNSFNNSNYTNTTNQTCGDYNTTGVQQCDDGNKINGDGCNSTCHFQYCSDAIVQGLEECDDGNTISGDGCSSDCKLQASASANMILGGGGICGDGAIQGQQQCDDGNTQGGDGCSAICKKQENTSALALALAIPLGVAALTAIGVGAFLMLKKSAAAAIETNPVMHTETIKFNGIEQQQLHDIE